MRPKIVISSDILGIFGNVADLEKVYGKRFRSLELIGWNMTLDKHLREARQFGYEISSIHGKMVSRQMHETSFSKTIEMILIDSLLKPTDRLIPYVDKTDLLLHSPHLDDPNNKKIIIQSANRIHFLWIENHYEKLVGVIDMLRVASELRQQGVPAGMVFDLAHFLGKRELLHGTDLLPSWKQMMQVITNTLFKVRDSRGQRIPIAIHFPIGTNRDDALPFDDNRLTFAMLKQFANIINSGFITKIVIENQQDGYLNHLLLAPYKFKSAKQRIEIVFEKIANAGIL